MLRDRILRLILGTAPPAKWDSVGLSCAIYADGGPSVAACRCYAMAAQLAREGRIKQTGAFTRATFSL